MLNYTMKVAVNKFVERQIEGSGKTYSKTLSFEFFANHAQEKLIKGEYIEGYRDGVCIINLDKKYVKEVYCPYVKINYKTKLIAKYIRRRKSEDPYIQIRALNGVPLKAQKVGLVLYRNDVLKENNENSTDSDWELISINSIPEGEEDLPIGPVTMMRNQLDLIGGTKAKYTSDEWAYSVKFWQRYAPLIKNDYY